MEEERNHKATERGGMKGREVQKSMLDVFRACFFIGAIKL